MLDSILTAFRSHPTLTVLQTTLTEKRTADVHGLGGSAGAFLLASLLGDDDIPANSVIAVCPDDEAAESLRSDVEAVIGPERVHYFPERDTGPYEQEDSHFEVRSQRVEALDMLSSGWKGVVVCTASALHDPTSPPGYVDAVVMELKQGGEIEFDFVVKSLIQKGFKRRNTIVSAGQLAVRGGIIDIFPFSSELPYRIEFWGDEIESIRTFSTSTQRSIDTVDSIRIIPPDEFITEAGLGDDEYKRLEAIERSTAVDLSFIREAFKNGDRQNGIEQYLYAVHGSRASLASHFEPSDIAVVFDQQFCKNELDKKFEHVAVAKKRLLKEDETVLDHNYMYENPDRFFDCFNSMKSVRVHSLRPPATDLIEFDIISSRQYRGSLDDLKKDVESFAQEGIQSCIVCDNSGQEERLKELLEDVTVSIRYAVAHLSGGMTDHSSSFALFTDHEIFSRYRRQVRYRKYKDGVPVPDHRALTLGDFIVHVDYGVGRFMGMKRENIGGAMTDFLLIEYKGDDQLLLPTGKLDKLKKFSSEEGVMPVVNKLGGNAWEKLKARTKKSIQRIAEDLLKLYAQRKTMEGIAFKDDDRMLHAMIDSFVYEETSDQLTAWRDVLKDMKSQSPMERLICGDVGFGKTEIAMRAAFLSVLNNRQVAVLVPTTILAEQHERTIRERFADFPVTIESLSRFRTPAQQKKIIERLSDGKIDIVVATHRLLSKDIHIKRLGLLIIDEEQRFGVRHKERLKNIRKHVDVLAMSATPIPRTLNMSLMGARDISYINTPPHDRYSVHTETAAFDEKLLVEAVYREIDRDGQVFFVHNRVKSIDSMADYLRRLMPNVTFEVAHGQLPEKKLADIMKRFTNREFQVLVSSMIIENGLDMPSVNTIIVNRADTFGLSQLYQLRGRVGRSNRRAYAFLLVPPKTTLSKIALKRLRTIEEFTGLGSGFNIAMRDLEIRGAGNILGTDQSGFISSIGFDMYVELLNEAISDLKGTALERPPEVEVHTDRDAFIPESYLSDPTERIVFYRRLAETTAPEQVSSIVEEMLDRYGRMPDEVCNLVDISFIRHYSSSLNVAEMWVRGTQVTLYIPDGVEIKREDVEKMVKKSPVKLNFSFEKGVNVQFTAPVKSSGALAGVKNVLQAMYV